MNKSIILVLCLIVFGSQNIYSQTDTVQINNEKINLPYKVVTKDKIAGAVDVVEVDALLKITDYNVSSTLIGKAAGLMVTKGNGGPGEYGAALRVRGFSRAGADNPLVVIDGIPGRSLNGITVEEIESISVLKDATTKMLYGSKAANGVILVTTKRGKSAKANIIVSGEYGIKTPTWMPEYLNSADYARAYRQAEINDGKTSLTYSEADIAKYESGNSPYRYPNVDYYDTFLKDQTDYQRINLQLQGGGDKTKYYVAVGYVGEGGLEKVGDERKFTRLNVRSNLDYVVNDIISMNLDIAGRFDGWKEPFISSSSLLSSLSSHRPNDYPLFVTPHVNSDSLGYSSRVETNLYGELTRKGYKERQVYYAQNNLGINFDLNSLVEGLSAQATASFDLSNYISTGKELSYSRMRIETSAGGQDSLVRVGVDDLKGTQKKFSDDFNRSMAGSVKINYQNQFGKSMIHANAVGFMQRIAQKFEVIGRTIDQDDKSINLGLDANYSYDNRYVLQLSSSYMGSDKFVDDERWNLYGAAGAAWIMSNESFLQSSSVVNYLKLKTSYGKMGYDWGYDYLLDRNEFVGGGSFRFGPNNSVSSYGQRLSQLGNPQLSFEEATEFNVGIEGVFLNNKLAIEANYFNELREGMPITSEDVLPDYVIGNVSAPTINYNAVSNKGFDISISYSNNIGELQYTIGGNMLYASAKYDKYSELEEYAHLSKEGRKVGTIFGFIADGLYRTQEEIDNEGITSSYSTLMPGDLRYDNITNDRGDNIINRYDLVEIGNGLPEYSYALNLNLQYKGVGLYVLGQGLGGYDRMLRGYDYFRNDGEAKYSVEALGAAIPTDPGSIENATHPRLSTFRNTHSYLNSTYWLRKGGFFKLRVVELSYQLPTELCNKISASGVRFFLKGTDLFTFTKVDEMDPETPWSGINDYPTFRNVAIGLNVTF